ncbi:uncharacterized protein RSE6_14159 [Rhynchosporium secalis]|uniref:Uncharacterized protein n=1 Tax=Rhynchosporium secalis TaxID=38038 RepID=A0A1E1MUK4_RHYSE|nr:uncharacterized protein RSE6_14159 [Rhynchosporium secalis]
MSTPGERFGLLLDDAGINRINRYNPQNLKENCAFVTIARLTNSSLDEFARMANTWESQLHLLPECSGERDLTNHFRQAEWWGAFWLQITGSDVKARDFALQYHGVKEPENKGKDRMR